MKKELCYIIGSIIAILIIVKACEQEPETIIKTKIEYKKVTDTVTKTIIEPNPKTVYVERIKTVKGKDSIIYVDKATGTTVEAKKYNTKLESNQATANLNITTTGELLDVSGTITYPEKTITNDITTIKAKSGLFLYTETSVNPIFERIEAGLDYQIRNTVIIGTSTSYDNVSKSVNFNVKFGFRIF